MKRLLCSVVILPEELALYAEVLAGSLSRWREVAGVHVLRPAGCPEPDGVTRRLRPRRLDVFELICDLTEIVDKVLFQ